MANYTGIFTNTPTRNFVNFTPLDGDWKVEYLPVKESVALQAGTLLGREVASNTSTGKLVAMGAEAASGVNAVGVLGVEVQATDSDYATAFKKKQIFVPCSAKAKAQFRVVSGTFTTADVGKTVEIADSGRGLAVDTAGLGATITKYLSATRGECVINFNVTETA